MHTDYDEHNIQHKQLIMCDHDPASRSPADVHLHHRLYLGAAVQLDHHRAHNSADLQKERSRDLPAQFVVLRSPVHPHHASVGLLFQQQPQMEPRPRTL